MEKKIYYIPMTEITLLSASLMDSGMAVGSGNNHSNPAPPRRDPVF